MSRCDHHRCVDIATVSVRFSGGEERDYCRFHAQHVGELDGVEMAS